MPSMRVNDLIIWMTYHTTVLHYFFRRPPKNARGVRYEYFDSPGRRRHAFYLSPSPHHNLSSWFTLTTGQEDRRTTCSTVLPMSGSSSLRLPWWDITIRSPLRSRVNFRIST